MPYTKAITYDVHGAPEIVLRIVEFALPSNPAPEEVRVKWLLAPIHPSDFGLIAGSYGHLKSLPAVGGREGVGEIVQLGAHVRGLKVGQRIVYCGEAGTWQTLADIPADRAWPVSKKIPLEQAAMALINPPTAWRLLEDFVQLKPGDWLIQNAANSAVGQLVIQLAKRLGVNTLNVVRSPQSVEGLKRLGADQIVLEGSGYAKQLKDLIGEARPCLALNAIGGPSALELIKCLDRGGTCVTYGGMSSEMVRFPTRALIFEGITLKGFWMDQWSKSIFCLNPKKGIAFYKRILKHLERGEWFSPIGGVYPLDDFRSACARAIEMGKQGKILLRP